MSNLEEAKDWVFQFESERGIVCDQDRESRRSPSLRGFGSWVGEGAVAVGPFDFVARPWEFEPWWGQKLRESRVRERHADKDLATKEVWELGARELEQTLFRLAADAKHVGAWRRRHMQEGFRSWPVPMPRYPRRTHGKGRPLLRHRHVR